MENNKYHILIVEDDKEIRDGVEIYLEKSRGIRYGKLPTVRKDWRS